MGHPNTDDVLPSSGKSKIKYVDGIFIKVLWKGREAAETIRAGIWMTGMHGALHVIDLTAQL